MFARTALFALGLFVVMAAVAVIGVYGSLYFELEWEQGRSIDVSIFVAAVLSVIGSVGFAGGLQYFRAAPSMVGAAIAGGEVGLALVGIELFRDSLLSHAGGQQFVSAGAAFAMSVWMAHIAAKRRRASV